MTHLIRQQYLHVELEGTESDGLALQKSLSALCRNWIAPAIEHVLDRCAPQDRHVVIERVEVDAGTLQLAELEHELPESIAQSLEKVLREKIRQLGKGVIDGVTEKTGKEVADEAFLHFLETGTLPWAFRLPERSTLEQVLLRFWEEAESAGKKPAVSGAIVSLLASPTARKRLIRQFSPLFLDILLGLLSQQGRLHLREIISTLAGLSIPSPEVKIIERELWDRAFECAARGEVLPALPAMAPHDDAATDVQRRRLHVLDTILARTTRGTGSGGNAGGAGEVAPLPNLSVQQASPQNAPRPAREHPEAREGIFVGNAGCILLHPFLPAFFEALHVAQGTRLVQPGRAVSLLHFLTTWQAVSPEYDSVLFKILCNIDLLEVIDADVELSDAEKDEADALLRAVISHWEALRSTSPDGLRGGFLIRPGKVTLQGDGDWLLQVEAQSCDILLEQLPWGLSVVKLPWMERMLWVEWR